MPREADVHAAEASIATEAWIGRSVPRVDGHRYVDGSVRYSADLIPAGALRVALVRSPHARARIAAVQTDAALATPGVAAVVDGAQAEALSAPMPQAISFRAADAGRPIVGRCLAVGEVCYAGQPVAAVVAQTRQDADTAAACVGVRYEPLPALLDAERSLAEGAPIVHPGWGSNVVAADHVRAGDARAAIEAAEHIVRGEIAVRPSTAARSAISATGTRARDA